MYCFNLRLQEKLKMNETETKSDRVISSINIYERQFREDNTEYYHNEMHNPIAIVITKEDGTSELIVRDKRFATCCWSGDSRDFIDSGHWDLDRLFEHNLPSGEY